MNQRTLKRLTVLAPLALGLAILGVGLVSIAGRISPQQTPGRRAAELQAIRVILRTTHSTEAFWDTLQRFKVWMARNIVRGRTTRADIVTYFGKEFQDLDRPPRDNIRAIVYPLYGDLYWGGNVVFYFNPRTAILRDWHCSHWVCGFCPHVLADDGRWRLEGKMLAGRLDLNREGSDTLLLPRLMPRDQRPGIRLANWAGEMEYIDRVQLGVVPCEPGYEVDVDDGGHPYVWKATRAVKVEPIRRAGGRDGWALSLGEPTAGRVIVLEARNTGEFESAMREFVFRPGTPWPPAGLFLRFDDSICRELQPVGTKFLRRIVVPVPAEARTLRVGAPAGMWLVRRAWLGRGHVAQDVAWLSATEASGGAVDALQLLRECDEDRLVLAPTQEVHLRFMTPQTAAEKQNRRFVLRMWGYYEVLPTCCEPAP